MVKKIFVVFLLLFIQKLSFAQKDSNVNLTAKELNKKFGFSDESGNLIIPYIYDYASNFYEGLAVVMLEKKVGLINKKNEIIVPLIYDDAGEPSEGLIAVSKGGKWGVINKSNKVIIPTIYDDIDHGVVGELFRNGLVKVKVGNKWGVINKSNKVIIPTIYDQLYLTYHGWIEVRKDGLEGVLNDQNKIIFPFKYNQISVDYDGIIYVQLYKNGEFINGCVSFQNKVIIPLIYDRPLYFQSDGLSEAQRGIFSYKINRQNKIVGDITAKYNDGSIYIGQIENSMRNGFGTLTFANGYKYVGNWVNDKREGNGTQFYEINEKYIGKWKNDFRDGEGAYYYPSGAKYIGHFKDDLFDGYGTFYYTDGSTFSGQWEKDKKILTKIIVSFSRGTEWNTKSTIWNGKTEYEYSCFYNIYFNDKMTKVVEIYINHHESITTSDWLKLIKIDGYTMDSYPDNWTNKDIAERELKYYVKTYMQINGTPEFR